MNIHIYVCVSVSVSVSVPMIAMENWVKWFTNFLGGEFRFRSILKYVFCRKWNHCSETIFSCDANRLQYLLCLFVFFSERRKDAIINGKGEKDEEKKKWSINSIPGKKLIIQLWYNVCQLSNEFMKYVCTHFSKIRSIGQILWLMYSFPLDSVSFFLFDFLLDKAY